MLYLASVSLNLEYFLILSLFFTTLTVFKEQDNYFVECPLPRVDLIFLITRFGSCIFWQEFPGSNAVFSSLSKVT